MTHIFVAGAGIGGLTAALAMDDAGLQVSVLERQSALAEFGAGLQLSPNATRILAAMNILDAVLPVATEAQAVRMRRGRDGVDLAVLPLGRSAVERYGAPFLMIHRGDLQQVLAEIVASRSAIHLQLGTAVEAVQQSAVGVRITVRGQWGSSCSDADGFVEAGGLHAFRSKTGTGLRAGRTAWRTLLPAAALPAAFARAETNLWLGSRAHLVHYPLRSGSLINVVAITEGASLPADGDEDLWSRPGDPNELRRTFADWHRDVDCLLRSATEWRRWPLIEGSPLSSWSEGPITRMGDAAHPMLPFLAQGASQAIEDAAALGAAFRDSGDVDASFRSYERRRKQRATSVQHASRRQGQIYHLPRPASDARDLVIGALGGARALARFDWLYGDA